MNSDINSTPFDKSVWLTLFKMFYKPNKRLFQGVIVLALITAATEASFTLLTKSVIDEVVANGKDAEIMTHAFIYFGLILIFTFCIRSFVLLAGKLSTELMYELRRKSFNHLQELSFSFYDQNAVGWLVARITSDCARISRMIAWGTLDMFWGIPYILGIFIVLFILNWQMAAMILVVFPFLFAVSVYFSFKILKSSRLVRRTNSRLTAVYNESLSGVQTSKVLVREKDNLNEFKRDTSQMYSQSMTNLLLSSAFFPIVTLFISIGTGMAMWFGGLYVMGSIITLGTLVAFVTYSRSLMDPMLEVAQTLTNLQRTTASAERVLGLLSVQPEIVDSEDVLQNIINNMESPDNSSDTALDGGDLKIDSINFKDINFSYKPEEPVLKNFNFKVEAGKTVALVGPTGSGKSTVVSLLARFYEPVSGQIQINGLDYRKRSLQWLQSNMSIVLQTPFLFSGSIKSNIQYGKLNASEDEIIAAAKRVNVHNIIMKMKDGYETVVEEGGDNLSTGQKQLISFARAIIGNPQLLIMDEATSSVDTRTEQLLQKSLETVLDGRTSFIIAHRLSTIRSADHILVIEDGELKESGDHKQLLAQRGKYYELYQKQFQKEKEEVVLEE